MPSDPRPLDASSVDMARQEGISSPVVTPEKTPGDRRNAAAASSSVLYRHNSPSSSTATHGDHPRQSYSETEGLTTRSAFEITSVSNAPPDGEDTEGHASKDAEELKRSLLEVEESIYYRVSTSSGESIETVNDDSRISLPDADRVGDTVAVPSLLTLDVPLNPSPKLFDPTGGNGPQSSSASRFRRINNYQRGRWFVTDIFEPEERSDSEMKMVSTHSTGVRGDGQATKGDVPVVGGGDSNVLLVNATQRKSTNNLVGMDVQPHPQDGGQLHSRSSSEISNPFPLDPNMFIAIDKQSSTAESIVSLSRTGSLSSVVKSVDEEERGSGDIDYLTEPAVSQTPDLLPRPYTSTAADREHNLVCNCDTCTSRYSCAQKNLCTL